LADAGGLESKIETCSSESNAILISNMIGVSQMEK